VGAKRGSKAPEVFVPPTPAARKPKREVEVEPALEIFIPPPAPPKPPKPLAGPITRSDIAAFGRGFAGEEWECVYGCIGVLVEGKPYHQWWCPHWSEAAHRQETPFD
jgi:hypothetical protein